MSIGVFPETELFVRIASVYDSFVFGLGKNYIGVIPAALDCSLDKLDPSTLGWPLNIKDRTPILTKNDRRLHVENWPQNLLLGDQTFDKKTVFNAIIQDVDRYGNQVFTRVETEISEQVFDTIILYFAQVLMDSFVAVIWFQGLVDFL